MENALLWLLFCFTRCLPIKKGSVVLGYHPRVGNSFLGGSGRLQTKCFVENKMKPKAKGTKINMRGGNLFGKQEFQFPA